MKVLVSACLLGQPMRYDGRHAAVVSERLGAWVSEGRVVALCPEALGGLSTPRPPAELRDDGVVNCNGEDVTAAFRAGAVASVAAAQRHGVRVAILKNGSPSCGHSQIHDGTFSGRRVGGQGLAARALVGAGVRVYSEREIDLALDMAEFLAGSRA